MKIFGWMTPSGAFEQCKEWQHYNQLIETEEIKKAFPEIENILSSLDNIEEGCQELVDRGEHGEWHRLEIAQSDARYEIYCMVFDAGFIRVGETNGTLRFEGRPNFIKSQYQRCKDLAESYNLTPVFEPY